MLTRIVFPAVVALFALTAPAGAAGDPFLKERQGRLSHEMSLRALAQGGAAVPGSRAFGRGAQGPVTAVIELEPGADAGPVRARVAAAGGRVLVGIDHLLKVQLPAASLRAVSETPGVSLVRAPFKPNRKEVISEGVTTTHAREYTARTGAAGAGVTVAVLDAGFAKARDLVGDELPANAAATDFVLERLDSYEGDHGTACAEIVHDMAPGADILLAGFEDDVTWAQSPARRPREPSSARDESPRSRASVLSCGANEPPIGGAFEPARRLPRVTARVLVALPAWNEAGNLDAVVSELRGVRPDVDLLVVNDGSTDETAAAARRLGCQVVSLPFNLGYGAAVQAGIKYGLRRGYPVVVTFDADGQHDPREIGRLEEAVAGGADLVIGSRGGPGSYAGGAARRAGRRLFAAAARLLTGLPLTDPTSGFKALGPRAQSLFALGRFPDRFPDADALVLARRAHLRVEERAVHMRPSRNRHSMHDGGAVSYTCNMLFSLLVAAGCREADLRR